MRNRRRLAWPTMAGRAHEHWPAAYFSTGWKIRVFVVIKQVNQVVEITVVIQLAVAVGLTVVVELTVVFELTVT